MASFQRVKIKDHCEITSSKRIFADEYLSSGVPFYRGKEISEKQRSTAEISGLIYISRKKFEEIKTKYGSPQKGDLLLTSVGTIGNPYLVKENEEFYFKDGNLTWFRNFQGINSRWLYYWLLSPQGKSELNKCTIGSSQKAYTINLLYGLQIDLPDLPTQTRIASVLSAYDDLIENNEKRVKALEEMAQLLYTEWFVKFKFPGREKVKMIDSGSEYGMIPEGWEVKRLKEVASFLEGPGLRNWQYKETGIPFLNIRTIGDGDIDIEKCNFLDKSEVDKKYPHFLLKVNDIVISSSGTLGRLAVVRKKHLPLCLNTSVIRFREIENGLPIWFIKQYLLSENFQSKIKGLASGSAQLNYGPSHLETISLIMPNEELLKSYTQKVASIETEIGVLRDSILNLSQTRDLLIPQLVTGKRELKQ